MWQTVECGTRIFLQEIAEEAESNQRRMRLQIALESVSELNSRSERDTVGSMWLSKQRKNEHESSKIIPNKGPA